MYKQVSDPVIAIYHCVLTFTVFNKDQTTCSAQSDLDLHCPPKGR